MRARCYNHLSLEEETPLELISEVIDRTWYLAALLLFSNCVDTTSDNDHVSSVSNQVSKVMHIKVLCAVYWLAIDHIVLF